MLFTSTRHGFLTRISHPATTVGGKAFIVQRAMRRCITGHEIPRHSPRQRRIWHKYTIQLEGPEHSQITHARREYPRTPCSRVGQGRLLCL